MTLILSLPLEFYTREINLHFKSTSKLGFPIVGSIPGWFSNWQKLVFSRDKLFSVARNLFLGLESSALHCGLLWVESKTLSKPSF